MNETYKWLYDYYALPLMKVGKQADALKSGSAPTAALRTRCSGGSGGKTCA